MSPKRRSPEVILAEILTARGIAPSEQDSFCNPDFERDTYSYQLLPDIQPALERLKRALTLNERTVLFGDYDADGIPATAIMTRVFRQLSYENFIPIIPTREQGYGLSPVTLEAIIASKPDLVITIDNGTTAKDEIATLTAKGIDCIVIDHHEAVAGHLAEPVALINPKVHGKYPFTELCAAGLVWKVAQGLIELLGGDEKSLRWLLDLVALATVADMVPLIGENRVLVTFGLRVLRKTRNEGLRALAGVAGVSLEQASARDIGFRLAPRINATSRMHADLYEEANASLTLLTTTDQKEASQLASYLNDRNAARQALVDTHLQRAEEQVDADAKAIVVFDESWSTGVIGLVASRLAETYRKPVIALAPEGGEVKGSVRTPHDIHAVELLEAVQATLARFGGHARAGGLTLLSDVPTFREHVASYMETVIREEGERQVVDAEITLEEADLSLAKAIAALEPFGIGFPAPRFLVRATARSVRRVGADSKHVSCFLETNEGRRKAIAFSYRGGVEEGAEYDVICDLAVDTWNGVESPVCHIRIFTKVER